MTTVKEKAYAKVNLYLNVVSRRDDGFHNIKTIMHSVSLCDDVTVSVSAAHKNLISMFVSGSGFCLPIREISPIKPQNCFLRG